MPPPPPPSSSSSSSSSLLLLLLLLLPPPPPTKSITTGSTGCTLTAALSPAWAFSRRQEEREIPLIVVQSTGCKGGCWWSHWTAWTALPPKSLSANGRGLLHPEVNPDPCHGTAHPLYRYVHPAVAWRRSRLGIPAIHCHDSALRRRRSRATVSTQAGRSSIEPLSPAPSRHCGTATTTSSTSSSSTSSSTSSSRSLRLRVGLLSAMSDQCIISAMHWQCQSPAALETSLH